MDNNYNLKKDHNLSYFFLAIIIIIIIILKCYDNNLSQNHLPCIIFLVRTFCTRTSEVCK